MSFSPGDDFRELVVDVCSMRLLLLVLRLGGFIDLRLVFETLFWSSEFDMSSLRYDDVSTLRFRALSCKKRGDISMFVVYNEEGRCWLSS